MLPARVRLRSADDFRTTIRRGVRAGRSTLVVHVMQASHDHDHPAGDSRVGFVVSKAVGGAVARNRVKRRLRHLCRPLVAARPRGLQAVVRALPSATDSAADLAGDLQTAWDAALTRLDRQASTAAAGGET